MPGPPLPSLPINLLQELGPGWSTSLKGEVLQCTHCDGASFLIHAGSYFSRLALVPLAKEANEAAQRLKGEFVLQPTSDWTEGRRIVTWRALASP